jgi:hypothetical protein
MRCMKRRLTPKMPLRMLIGLFFISLLAMHASAGGNASNDEDDYGPIKPYKVTAIKSVVIKNNAAWTDDVYSDETPEDCSKFKLSERDVRDFFRRARQIDHETYGAAYLASRCYATGEIVFANRDRGIWRIDFERRGALKLSDGRQFYLFCSTCRSKAYYP